MQGEPEPNSMSGASAYVRNTQGLSDTCRGGWFRRLAEGVNRPTTFSPGYEPDHSFFARV